MKIDTTNFRTDLNDYFSKFVFSVNTTRKQMTPFVIITPKEISSVYYTKDLFNMKPSTQILQTWPGQYKADVFSFTVKELKEWVKENPDCLRL
jgi:hypothetical protein